MTPTASAAKTAARPKVMPIRRDVHFDLPPERVGDWACGNPHFTHLMNAFSLVIPVGERFFIDAVRYYRDRITDPELKKAATAFIGQEAMHGREHDQFNAQIFAHLPDAERFERRITALLRWVQENFPPSMRLSATIALEHLTAIMADGLLSEPRLKAESEPGYAALWHWHALEETEHKAVAYDVWETTQGTGPLAYAQRSFGLVLATTIFWAEIIPAWLRFLKHEGRLTDLKGWRAFYRLGFGEIGFLRKMVRPWLAYFRPDFHPWDHDNRHFLEGVDEWTAAYARPAGPMRAAA